MALQKGTRFGPYEVVEQIGAVDADGDFVFEGALELFREPFWFEEVLQLAPID